jgi:nitroreductase
MSKRLDTRYPVLPAILDRWSPRSFVNRQPEPEKLRSMFEAARLAPSAHNTQPVRFLVGRKGQGDAWERLFAALDPHNQEWAHGAPVLVLASVMRRRFSQVKADFVPYPHAMHDLGLAVMSLTLQAQHMDLHCHLMAAFDPEKAQADFEIPALFAPGIIIAIGYLGAPETLPPELREKETSPRTRRPLEEIVFEEAWGESSPLFADDAAVVQKR